VLAIEPNSALVERFKVNVSLGRKSGWISSGVTIRTANVAISDYDGEGFLSDQRKEGIRRLVSQSTENPVRVFRLETLLAEHGIDRIDLMKIDIEGHEDRVLPGFLLASPLPLWPRSIIIEHLSRKQWAIDCIEACVARGYRIEIHTRQNSILSR
jgi:FkbM family methyltransferase